MPCAVVGDGCFHFCLFISCGKMLVLSLTCQPFFVCFSVTGQEGCCQCMLLSVVAVWSPPCTFTVASCLASSPVFVLWKGRTIRPFRTPGGAWGEKNRRSFKVYIMRLFCIGMLTQRCRTKKKKKVFRRDSAQNFSLRDGVMCTEHTRYSSTTAHWSSVGCIF